MPAATGLSKGFRGLKTVGWKWHKTRRLDPTRVGRHWLVLVIATWLAVASGTRREDSRGAAPASPGPSGAGPPPAPRRVDCGPAGGLAPASRQPLAAGRGAAAARLSVGLHVAATYAQPRLPHAPAPGGPLRHLNLPALSARDPHRSPPTLYLHSGRLGLPHQRGRPAAARPVILPPRGLFFALTRPLPSHARAKPTDPAAAADSHPGNTLAKSPPPVRPSWIAKP